MSARRRCGGARASARREQHVAHDDGREGCRAVGAGAGAGAGAGGAAGAPRQGESAAARRVDALEAGDYGGAGPEEEEEEDFAERFTRCLLEDASGGY